MTIIYIISTIFSVRLKKSIYGSINLIFEELLLGFIIYDQFSSREEINKALNLVLLGGFISISYGMVEIITGYNLLVMFGIRIYLTKTRSLSKVKVGKTRQKRGDRDGTKNLYYTSIQFGKGVRKRVLFK